MSDMNVFDEFKLDQFQRELEQIKHVLRKVLEVVVILREEINSGRGTSIESGASEVGKKD